MERKSRLIGMPLISIKEGCECGNVSQIVVDAGAKRVTHLIVGNGVGLMGYNMALPIECLVGAGRDFITTSESGNLVQVYTIGDPLVQYMCDCEVIGIQVVSSSGNIEGKIEDFAFDTTNGDILECYMADEAVIARKNMITLAKKGLFIEKDTAAKSSAPAPVTVSAPPKTEVDSKKEAPKNTDGDSDDYFVKKQSEYLIGRKSKKEILGSDGTVLIGSGVKVTPEIVEKIRQANKLTELMLHVE